MNNQPKNLEEALKNVAWIRTEIERTTGIKCLTDEELAASRQDLLADFPANDDLWVFGYGSLIWKPLFDYEESRTAKLQGYSRAFCIDLPANRGTPERPGLMLALDEGGACEGVAFRISASKREPVLEDLWIREMLAAVYTPKLLPLEIGGITRPGLVFVVNRTTPRYTPFPLEEAAKIVAQAEGSLGTNRDYLFQLVEKLEEHSIHDAAMATLYEKVKAHH